MQAKHFKLLAVSIAFMGAFGGGLTLSTGAAAQTAVSYDVVKQAIGDGTRPGANAFLLDTRESPQYDAGTIPSSRNIPMTDKPDLAAMDGWDKSKTVIVFDADSSNNRSKEMANYLVAQGYADVKIFAEGLKGWQGKNYLEVNTPVVEEAFKKNAVLMMDARPYPKFLGGTIPGALAMPDNDIQKLSTRFPVDKAEYIVTYCSGFDCGKSHDIAKVLWDKGYHNVQVYAAGYPAWKKAGLQTTEGGKPVAAPVDRGPAKFVNGIMLGVDEGSVDGPWFKEQLEKGTVPADVLLIDARKEGVYSNGHLNGAINIPVANLKSADIPSDKVVVFVCMTGSSALESYMKIESEGKADMSRVYYFDANIACKGNDCKVEPNEPLGN